MKDDTNSSDPSSEAANAKTDADMDPNAHVKEYLTYFFDLAHPPRYAVLLNGPWGIGKTFIVKKFLRNHFAEDKDYIYVSLYGIRSPDEIDAALFGAMYPILSNKAVKLAGKAANTIFKHFRVQNEIKLDDVLDKFSARVYIFDDLERCEMPINSVLGYVNNFVEHSDCKVVIIANETEINDEKYKGRREKIVGKTLEVRSAIDEALNEFTKQVDDLETRGALEENLPEIKTIYSQSTLENLRILQQTIWDFERLCLALRANHRANKAAIKVLLQLFFALSFELKAGRIEAADLSKRLDRIVAGHVSSKKDEPKPPLFAAASRYPEIELHNSILSDDVLVDVLVRGVIDPSAIAECLDRSPHFVSKADEPSWRAVWHSFERTDAESEDAFRRMEEEFVSRAYTEPGEILHVFGLRLWLSDIEVLQRSRSEIVSECRSYVDDLYQGGRLKPLDMSEGISGDAFEFAGYGGLGIHENETPEYKELFRYLREQRLKAREDSYGGRGEILLSEMGIDPSLFYRRLNYTNTGDSVYQRVPILASIDPERFVEALLSLHPSIQRTVLMALKARYEHGQLDRDLAPEKAWITDVRDKLLSAANAMQPMPKARLQNLVKWYVDPVLSSPSLSESNSA